MEEKLGWFKIGLIQTAKLKPKSQSSKKRRIKYLGSSFCEGQLIPNRDFSQLNIEGGSMYDPKLKAAIEVFS